jgi:class 3 adenylate cyclase
VTGAAHGSELDELRPVTVLFADIVGSTALGERLGPAEVKALVGDCVTQMSRAVEEYGGSVQAYQGDGICAYFGVPVAHEDDPERAVRTALRILEVLGEYARDICAAWGISDFNVRVGINTGQAGVGLVGAADPQAVALGDTTNVAARLEASAAPGTILVGEEVARRLAHRFLFEPVGDIAAKGRSASVAASRLVGPKREERAAAPPPLVDREAELERLRTATRELQAGRGQILLLVGEPGIGKTRLLAELRSIASDEVTWLEGECLSYGGLHSWPLIEVLRRWLGVEPGDPEIAVRTKAHAKLGALLGPRLDEFLPALGRLLQIRVDRDGPTEPLAGEDASDEIERAYLTWIEALAAERPVLLALEDMQWAHASTRRIAEALLALTDRVPLLLAATTRREPGSEGWRFRLRVLSDYAHRSTELALAPLADEAAGRLLDTLLPGALDGDSRAELIARAEGNPLYLEELLQALVHAGGMRQTRRAWTVTPRSADLLPPALENLLVARIDRLPDGPRRLAQAAAAIGRAFPLRALDRVFASEDLQQDLEVLLRGEIVHELRRYPEREYTFKHGLLQEAALSTLTPLRRRDLYRRVASAFEELGTDSLDDLERLAHYYAQGDDLAKALDYLERAASAAEALNAVRARDLWRRAEALASRLGDSDAARRLEERAQALRA